MKRLFIVLVVAALALPSTASAQTTVLDFENTGVGHSLPLGTYGGFNWGEIRLASNLGGITSGQYAVYTHCCTSLLANLVSPTPFQFNGAYFSLWSGGGQRLVGYLGAAQVFNVALNLGSFSTPIWNDFSAYGWIDQLVFTTATGGTSQIGNVVMDDFTYTTSVPEPGVILLAATGLLGLAAERRRRRMTAC